MPDHRILLPPTVLSLLLVLPTVHAVAGEKPEPLVIGETFKIESKILGETRRINVFRPPAPGAPDARLPVLYMLDGGLGEDFLHVAGLVQVLTGNGTMRPFLLVGIENTERRRDLTGPTRIPDDRKIAPRVGGSESFRKFLREELMPQVKDRYRTSDESAIVGESMAGLFVVETFFLEPDLFHHYLAFDPSLWWNDRELLKGAGARLRQWPGIERTLYLASSDEPGIASQTHDFGEILKREAPAGIHWLLEKMPEEKHSTIYHPAALKAFRVVFKPAAAK